MNNFTARLALPMLHAGQAQKELTHNEALTLVDACVHASVEEAETTEVPVSPEIGRCWIVSDAAGGDWQGRSGALAAWTEGGWRFVVPTAGMQVWNRADGISLRYSGLRWVAGEVAAKCLIVGGKQVVGAQVASIAPPQGGTVVDTESRAAINAILAALTAHGLVGG